MPDRPSKKHQTAYRAYRVTAEGHVTGAPTILDAETDEEAVAQARHLVDGAGVEVWDLARRVIALPPKEQDGRRTSVAQVIAD